MSTPAATGNGRARGRIIVHERQDPEAPVATERRPCPLLAVCGLCGGAGTTTLAYLLARYVARHGPGHVLVADTGGPSGGLAAAARVDAGRTLAEAGELLEHELAFAPPLYRTAPSAGSGDHELRVLATGPQLHGNGRPEGAAALLTVARHPDTHALVIIDCGTLQRAPERFVARHATHIAWLLPATARGAEQAMRVLGAIPLAGARELVIARHDPARPTPPQRALTALGERRHAPLILFPHFDDVDERPERALETATVPLQAILGVLGR